MVFFLFSIWERGGKNLRKQTMGSENSKTKYGQIDGDGDEGEDVDYEEMAKVLENYRKRGEETLSPGTLSPDSFSQPVVRERETEARSSCGTKTASGASEPYLDESEDHWISTMSAPESAMHKNKRQRAHTDSANKGRTKKARLSSASLKSSQKAPAVRSAQISVRKKRTIRSSGPKSPKNSKQPSCFQSGPQRTKSTDLRHPQSSNHSTDPRCKGTDVLLSSSKGKKGRVSSKSFAVKSAVRKNRPRQQPIRTRDRERPNASPSCQDAVVVSIGSETPIARAVPAVGTAVSRMAEQRSTETDCSGSNPSCRQAADKSSSGSGAQSTNPGNEPNSTVPNEEIDCTRSEAKNGPNLADSSGTDARLHRATVSSSTSSVPAFYAGGFKDVVQQPQPGLPFDASTPSISPVSELALDPSAANLLQWQKNMYVADFSQDMERLTNSEMLTGMDTELFADIENERVKQKVIEYVQKADEQLVQKHREIQHLSRTAYDLQLRVSYLEKTLLYRLGSPSMNILH